MIFVAFLLFGPWYPNVIGISALNSSHLKLSLYLKFTSSEGDYIFDDLQSPQHEFFVYLISSILHQAIPYMAQLFFDKLI